MNREHLKKIKRRDRLARWVITISGITVIVAVIGILFLIAGVAIPLFKAPRAHQLSSFSLDEQVREDGVLALGLDDYLKTLFVLNGSGVCTFLNIGDAARVAVMQLEAPEPGARPVSAESRGDLSFAILWTTGHITMEELKARRVFSQDGEASIKHSMERMATFTPPASQALPILYQVRISEEGRTTLFGLDKSGALFARTHTVDTDFLGNEKLETSATQITNPLPGNVTSIALDSEGAYGYAGTDNGYLIRWKLQGERSAILIDRFRAFPDGRAISSLGLVFGDVSLAVGDATGGLTTWTPTVTDEKKNERRLLRLHTLTAHAAPIESIQPLRRNKSILSRSENGVIHIDHMTSERHLFEFVSARPIVASALSSRGNGLIAIDDANQVTCWKLSHPHPETSWKTLFGKVWYESYPGEAAVWQSSSGTDEFEPKLSLLPLIFGSIKGTFYAMIFAIPIALLGAIYISQFATDKVKKTVKPAVEIMAAIPSVVIGFLAALWLAPIVEDFIVGFFVMLLVIPLSLVITVSAWQKLRNATWGKRVEQGYEWVAVAPVLLVAVLFAAWVAPHVESSLFKGNFTEWLYLDFGERYDPRNCIIIAFALGFAVIPIIFTISEDALSNVPHSLKAASLAIGASRWQTVWRVVLPSASPGIFAGVIIGLGRAVGETMIVLMATGNTPIMDWSAFNGMRTLSANIAVEIPEAPVGGTLYRVLFLSGTVLFVITFIINTLADIVRQQLRKKYGRL